MTTDPAIRDLQARLTAIAVPAKKAWWENYFTAAQIFDWNTCDWFCVRVLGPTLVREGEPFAAALSAWKDAPYLWQARSAAVPFIQVVDQPAFRPRIAAVCTTLIQRPERFAKTAVGWLLRELSRHDAPFVVDFTTRHAGSFSVESARNAAKYLPEDTQRQLREGVKASSGPVAGS